MNGHAAAILYASTPRLVPRQSALAQAHDDLHAAEVELARLKMATRALLADLYQDLVILPDAWDDAAAACGWVAPERRVDR
jgi:hypothetical protein